MNSTSDLTKRINVAQDIFETSFPKIFCAKSGLHLHHLYKFATHISVKGKGKKAKAKVTIEIPMDQLGSEMEDVRAVSPPFVLGNDLIPMVVFIDAKKAERFIENLNIDG